MAELRSFIFIDQLQPQTMCYLGTWIRGSLPRTGMAALDQVGDPAQLLERGAAARFGGVRGKHRCIVQTVDHALQGIRRHTLCLEIGQGAVK